MFYFEVAPNQIIRSNTDVFTYASIAQLAIGTIVVIEVGKKQLVGIVMKEVTKPTYDTKQISSTIEPVALPSALVQLAHWLSTYYKTPLATVLQTILPRGIQKARRPQHTSLHSSSRDRTKIVFTLDQQQALDIIDNMTPGSAILHGVTGSGKTHVYIELVKRSISRGESAIILVPEIALTSQLVDEFSHHFEDILLTHSRQTEAQRHLTWKNALESTIPRVVIGPRSALFLPLQKIGVIIIDEAHEPAFKQEQAPRYSALRAASILAGAHRAKLILGSATPLVTDYYTAPLHGRPIIEMPTPARQDTLKPIVHLIDMTKHTNFKQHRFLSDVLLMKLSETFASGKQALVFHNRRGSASTTLCENCGWSAMCQRCFVPLTLHADKHHLRCHICGLIEKVPTSCPVCQHTDIVHKGIGTKLIESELRKIYPDKIILRFDGDSESGESIDQKYEQLYNGKIDLIIGTQVVAKGLDLPHLRTVGVIQADAGLSMPDYTSSERTFQLLAQVVGRVGRSHHKTDVVVQSYQPTHPAVVDGLTQNYTDFYTKTLVERKKGNFPPFCYLLRLTCIYKTEKAAVNQAQVLAAQLRQKLPNGVEVLGPVPSFYERQHNTYRWQLTLKSAKRQLLIEALDHVPSTHWQTELDPISLL
ncbi:MAG: primosomal protein N' [Candidatus Saccharimonadales bacterium]